MGDRMHDKEKKTYKILRKHLHKMPVGYPATYSGVELRLLQRMFTREQAVMATMLTHVFEPVNVVCEKANKQLSNSIDESYCGRLLDEMAGKGGVFCKVIDGRKHYALVPFVVGMFEFQVTSLTARFYDEAIRYFREGYALEYLSTAVPQMRVIPINQSIAPKQHIATYDEVRSLIANAGDRIGVADCICRKGKDLSGDPCKITERRNLCLGLRDYFDTYSERGWLRKITKEEAFEILSQSETEGLVLQTTNEREPQAICACCGCCCGILLMLKHVPNRAEFAGGNFRARVDSRLCVGCGKCLERCHVGAIFMTEKRVEISLEGCIGCGVCVPVCKKGAMSLVPGRMHAVPPADTTELYDTILKGKGRMRKVRTGMKILKSRFRDRGAGKG